MLSPKLKDEMLGEVAAASVSVGLFRGEVEIDDPNYERLRVELSEPRGDETRYVENLNELRYPRMGSDQLVDGFGLFSEDGQLMARFALIKPRELPADDNAVFHPGSLKVGIP